MADNLDLGAIRAILVAQIRKEAVSYTAKWLIGGVAALLLAAAVGWWFFLEKKFDEYIVARAGVPANAVIAFDRPDSCPKGWTAFTPAASRTIVGATTTTNESPNKDANGNILTPRAYRAEGGEEKHTLTVAEMPSHVHPGRSFNGSNAFRTGNDGDGLWEATANSGTAGGDQPHNVMPPFIALYYCTRT